MNDIEISVITPCYNEEGNILPLCRRINEALAPLGLGFEMICVDDGSKDHTADMIREAQKEYPFLTGVYKDTNQGIVAGWYAGYEKSRGRYVVTIDADLQYRPENIVDLYRRMQQGGADMVQGRRQSQVDQGLVRWVLSLGLSSLLNLTFGMRLKDNKSGFILYRREVLGDLLRYHSTFNLFQHFITIAAHSRGFTIVQEPVPFDRRKWGKSFIQNPLRFSWRVMGEFGRAIYEFRLKQR